MRRALIYIVVAAAYSNLSAAAERKSWNKIRYIGGTIAVKTTPYDWNTTITATAKPDSIVLVIAPAKLFAPQQTVRLQPSQVISLSHGLAAWHRVAEVPGSQLPPQPPTLFGIFEDHGFFGIVYEADNGKHAAVLLESYFSWKILAVLEALTGKSIERSP